MANIYKISAYGELSPGGTTRQLETYFVQSQPIYDYLTNNPPPFVINSSGEFSAVDVENEFKMVMGDSPIGKHIEVFCGLLENEGQPSIPFYGNVLNMCGFTPTYIQPVTYDPDTNIPMFYNCHLVNKNVDVGDLGYGRIHAGEYVGYQPASKFSYGSFHCHCKYENIEKTQVGNIFISIKWCHFPNKPCKACIELTKNMDYYLKPEIIKKLKNRV